MGLAETDLYEPIRRFLEEEGYEVQAEVKDCDIAARKDGRLVVVELKRSFQLKLVYQAMERQRLTEYVYVAIPRPKKGQRKKSWKDMLRLLKRLEVGLLTVALDSPLQSVEVVLEPSDSMVWKKKKKEAAVLREMDGRNVSANTGGTSGKKIVTAYRERALELCCILEGQPEVTYDQLRQMGLEERQLAILRSNFYRWFRRISRGVYALSEEGAAALSEPAFAKVVAYYREKYQHKEEV